MRYPARRMELGILEREDVLAAIMPRADFLDEVDQLLRDNYDEVHPSVRERIWPVAQTMERFPMGTWINPTRGCGCLLGEYLVAADLIQRQGFAQDLIDDVEYAHEKLCDLVFELPNGNALWEFGNEIDSRLNMRLCANGVEGHVSGDIDVIVIED